MLNPLKRSSAETDFVFEILNALPGPSWLVKGPLGELVCANLAAEQLLQSLEPLQQQQLQQSYYQALEAGSAQLNLNKGKLWLLQFKRLAQSQDCLVVQAQPQVGQQLEHLPRTRLLEQIIRFMPNPVFIKDRQHRWMMLNEAFGRLFGSSVEDMLGKSDFDFFPADEAQVFWEQDNEVFTQGKVSVNEESFTDASGQKRWILTHKSVFIDDSGKPVLVGVITDITERRQLEEELRLSHEAAENSSQIKTEFMARMSHELRTPLNAILGFSQVLKKQLTGLSPLQSKYLERLHHNGLHLLDLINDVLDLSRIESGHLRLHYAPCDLKELLSEIIASFQAQLEKKQLSLELSLQEARLETDALRLRQIISNLIDNAIKYTDTGSISLTLKTRKHHPLYLEVKDTGPGIPKQLEQHIFESFQQKDVHQEGVGLGLAIARHLAQQMGYQLRLCPTENAEKGACFQLDFQPDFPPA